MNWPTFSHAQNSTATSAGRPERVLSNALDGLPSLYPLFKPIRECRDPKDDKFLEVALNGRADVIITGDADLLGMQPWRGIDILAPADYLLRTEGQRAR